MMQGHMGQPFSLARRLTLLAMLLLLLTATPLAVYWLQPPSANVPDCAAPAVIARLRQATGLQVALRHIHSVGIDYRLGHRICSARVGPAEATRSLKYAVYLSAADGDVVLVLD